MHGRKKPTQPSSEAELTAIQRKAVQISALYGDLIMKKNDKNVTTESLELTAKILRTNPDFYSAWNYRREILMAVTTSLSLTPRLNGDKLSIPDLTETELQLSEDCIKKNPKSCE